MNHAQPDRASTDLMQGEAVLSSVRLRPTRGRRGGTWGALGWVSGSALVLAAGWFVFALLRPLEGLEGAEAAKPPPKVELFARSTDVSSRQAVLSGLTSENVYSHKRRPWSTGSATAEAGEGAGASPGGNAAAGDSGAALAPESVVPPDIKPAYDNLRLVGLFEARGTSAMMLSFVQGGDPAKAKVFRVGDEITDPQHPTPTWKVLGIDLMKRSAVLSRGGRQVELRVFANVPAVVSAGPKAGGVGAPAVAPVVVPAGREEIVAKLREAKISEQDIALLMKDLGPVEGGASGEATAAAIEKVLNPSEGGKPAEGAPPAGLEEVLKMMAQRRGGAAAGGASGQADPPAPKSSRAPGGQGAPKP